VRRDLGGAGLVLPVEREQAVDLLGALRPLAEVAELLLRLGLPPACVLGLVRGRVGGLPLRLLVLGADPRRSEDHDQGRDPSECDEMPHVTLAMMREGRRAPLLAANAPASS